MLSRKKPRREFVALKALAVGRPFAGCAFKRRRSLVIADRVSLSCDLSFVCLASRRHEPMIADAFRAMQAVWDLAAEKAPA